MLYFLSWPDHFESSTPDEEIGGKIPNFSDQDRLDFLSILQQARNRCAYRSGGYSMKALGEYFGLHYSRIRRIVRHEKTKSKT